VHCKIKWKLCSSFSFQYFIKFTRLIIESRHRRNNNALCSPLSRDGDNVSCPMRFAAESINRLRRNVWGARDTTGLLTGRLHMTMMIGQRDILRAWCRVYRCLQQAAFTSKVCSTSACGAPSREKSPRGHVDRQCASVCATAVWWQVGMLLETRQLLPLYRHKHTCV